MTDPPLPLPWETAAPNAFIWTNKAYDMLVADQPALTAHLGRHDGILNCQLTGHCPRCNHDITQTRVLSAVTTQPAAPADEPAIRAAANQPTPVIISCTCSYPHPGRPETHTAGCGINFKLLLHEEVS